MDNSITDKATLQNLEDAGCDGEIVKCFCELEQQPRQEKLICKDQIRLLCQQRKALLKDLHGCQKKLDCLDYLLFKLKEKEKQCCCTAAAKDKEAGDRHD